MHSVCPFPFPYPSPSLTLSLPSYPPTGDWRYVYPSELKTFRTISARQRLISTGFIGRAWAANYTVTSRLPLHPSIGDINEPYEPFSSSLPDSLPRNQGQSGAQVPLSSSSQDMDVDDPLSHTAISFVHGGLSPTYEDLTPFPSKINELGKSLLHKLQNRKQPDPHPPARKPGLPEGKYITLQPCTSVTQSQLTCFSV